MEPKDIDTLRRLQTMISMRGVKTEGDAFASLCLVSYFLFKGGKSRWQAYLDAACAFSLAKLNGFGGPSKVLLGCSESLRLIIKTSIWFDVIASITLVRSPLLLHVYQEIFSPHQVFFDEEMVPSMEEYSMMPIMGCENHIVLALAEIAALASWKEEMTREGSLGVLELVKHSEKIREILRRSSHGVDVDARFKQCRLTSEVTRASALIYLHSVISGDFLGCPEIIEAVDNTVECLRSAEDGLTGQAVVRSVVFSICICSCLTEDFNHQAYFLRRLQDLQQVQGFSIGNFRLVSHLIQGVWKRRFLSREAIDWRRVMREARVLLL